MKLTRDKVVALFCYTHGKEVTFYHLCMDWLEMDEIIHPPKHQPDPVKPYTATGPSNYRVDMEVKP